MSSGENATMDPKDPIDCSGNNKIDIPELCERLGLRLPKGADFSNIDRMHGDLWSFLRTGVTEMCRECNITKVQAVALNLFSTIPVFLQNSLPDTVNDNVLENAKTDFQRLLFGKMNEEIWMRCLDDKNNILTTIRLARGTVSEVYVTPRMVTEKALAVGARRVMLAHNHPNCDPTPSVNDYYFTQVCQETLRRWNVYLIDHFIIGARKVYSFADDGKLERDETALLVAGKKK